MGWPYLSWLFLPFGMAAIRKNSPARLISFVFPSLVVVYLFYWVGSWIYGPRYYYEGLYSFTLLTAAGIVWIYQRLPSSGNHFRFFTFNKGKKIKVHISSSGYLGFTILLAFLITANLLVYIPTRLGVNRALRRQPQLAGAISGTGCRCADACPGHRTSG